jgi:SAM-dependent methyltransferase
MTDQAHFWSSAAQFYEREFIDPDLPGGHNPLRDVLAGLAGKKAHATVADLGCGIGPLLPFLAQHFRAVLAVDFAEGMLGRARQHCRGLANVTFLQRSLTDLAGCGPVDVAVAVNSLVLPDLAELEKSLAAIHGLLRPGGTFLGIVPAMDSVHYLTLLLLDRARRIGMPQAAARKNAATNAEHELYDFAFSEFRFRGLVQHFWQPFEVPYRLRQAGFGRVRLSKVALSWDQFACGKDLADCEPPWDWFFQAKKKKK